MSKRSHERTSMTPVYEIAISKQILKEKREKKESKKRKRDVINITSEEEAGPSNNITIEEEQSRKRTRITKRSSSGLSTVPESNDTLIETCDLTTLPEISTTQQTCTYNPPIFGISEIIDLTCFDNDNNENSVKVPDPEPANIQTYYSKDCPICLESIDRVDTASTLCGHIFCMGCIQKALRYNKKQCPVCKKKLFKIGYHRIFL